MRPNPRPGMFAYGGLMAVWELWVCWLCPTPRIQAIVGPWIAVSIQSMDLHTTKGHCGKRGPDTSASESSTGDFRLWCIDGCLGAIVLVVSNTPNESHCCALSRGVNTIHGQPWNQRSSCGLRRWAPTLQITDFKVSLFLCFDVLNKTRISKSYFSPYGQC